ncbi:MAG: mechanosensitive ion channel, partial [Polyangiaceae bacterium]|nr:mechanosensitive ion channel [Polyangiaceae bacterium]
EKVENKAILLLRWLMLYLWVTLVSRTILLDNSIFGLLRAPLKKEITLGSISITASALLTLVLGVFIAVVVARLIRFLLAEEVLPRTTLKLGSRAALTTGTYAITLGFGLFVALAAGGMQLSQLTILVSAFGVGIGFGLQNLVQNFVAGLLLLLGRPVNVGDTIQVDTLLGEIKEIGFRASTIRTFQGAEVILPNSFLVSQEVTNWTLSDQRRRIELDVGIRYGADPRPIMEILTATAREHPKVCSYPEPDVVFSGFGDSSVNLQLRAWTDEGSSWKRIQTEISLAVVDAFRENDVEIPFPQRDLHIKDMIFPTGGSPSLPGNQNAGAESRKLKEQA